LPGGFAPAAVSGSRIRSGPFSAGLPQRPLEVVSGQRKHGLKTKRLAVLLDGRGPPPLEKQDVTEIVVRARRRGIDPEGALELLLRLVETPLAHEARSQLVVSGRKIREEIDRGAQVES